ncbi:MAG TPA: hypothetical protein VL947_11850, partial [Cytophagales bacterium]|nr:hypothetical protein [Cytophagales bacterium]
EEVTRTTNLFINQVTVTKSSTMGRLQFRDVPDNPDSKYRYHRRRNLSLNLGFVYEYYRFLVEVKYEFGLANQLALPASKDSEVVTDRYNTSTLGLSLGYYLK